MNVMWIPIVLICTITTPKVECTETTANVTVLRANPQTSPMACLMAAMGRYAAYENAPALGEAQEPRFICREYHSDN